MGDPFTIKVGADDPSSTEMAAQFTYTVDWGDGSPVRTVNGPADPPVTHTDASEGDFAATFTATDKDGGIRPGTEVVVVSQVSDESDDSDSDDSGSPDSGSSDTDLASTGSPVGLGAFLLSLTVLASGGGLLLEARRRRRTVTRVSAEHPKPNRSFRRDTAAGGWQPWARSASEA